MEYIPIDVNGHLFDHITFKIVGDLAASFWMLSFQMFFVKNFESVEHFFDLFGFLTCGLQKNVEYNKA